MKTRKVFGDIYVRLDIPSHMERHARYVANHLPRDGVTWDERYAESMEEQANDWIKELVEFIRDHRSRDKVDMTPVIQVSYACGECDKEHKNQEDADACCIPVQAPAEVPHAHH